MVERLSGTSIVVHVVEDVPSAALDREPDALAQPPCIAARFPRARPRSELEDVKLACERVRKAAHAIPHSMPIAVTSSADAGAVVALVRAGAGDVIDLQLEGTGSARASWSSVSSRASSSARSSV